MVNRVCKPGDIPIFTEPKGERALPPVKVRVTTVHPVMIPEGRLIVRF